MTAPELRRLRLRAQHLEPRAARGELLGVVHDLCGVQAQLPSAAALALRARIRELRPADLDEVRQTSRGLVRTWAWRGTLHLLASSDLPPVLALTGPVFTRAMRGRRLQLGLDDGTSERALATLATVLAGAGPLPRAEIVRRLDREGIELRGQAVPHLLALAALSGSICCGPERGRDSTYVLLGDWLGRSGCCGEGGTWLPLAQRYLAGYGPATRGDLAAWSGLPAGAIAAAWEKAAAFLVPCDDGPGNLRAAAGSLESAPAAGRPPVVRLLPAYDTYLLGYAERETIVSRSLRSRIYHGGLVVPTLIVDGRAAGTWRHQGRGRRRIVEVAPFAPLPAEVLRGIAEEADDIGRFLGQPASLSLSDPG